MVNTRINYVCFLWSVCCLRMPTMEAAVAYTDVKDDYETLLTAYEISNSVASARAIIPKNSQTEAITVNIGMHLYAVMDFNAVDGNIQLVGSMSIEWQDDIQFIITGTTFKANLQTIFVSYDQIWTPNLVLVNSAESVERIGDSTYKVRYNVSSGYCKWKPRMIINAACTPDMMYYPFDEQTCTLTVIPWFRDSDKLRVATLTNEWNTADLDISGIWDVYQTTSEASITGETYKADFTIVIKRKPLFLAIVLVLPILLLSLLTGFLFLLPPGSGSRVGFGMTCFLSFVVMLQTLIQFLPESSVPMSLLCYYIITMLMFSCGLSIVNIFLLRLYMGPGSDKVPDLLIAFLTLITCIPCRRWHRKYKKRAAAKALIAREKAAAKARIARENAEFLAAKGLKKRTMLQNLFRYAKELRSCKIWRHCKKSVVPGDFVMNSKWSKKAAMVANNEFSSHRAINNLIEETNPDSESTTVRARHVGGMKAQTDLQDLLQSNDYYDDDKREGRKSGKKSPISRQDSDDSLKIQSDITWEYIGQLLDIFFLVTFCAVQTVFTMIFLVPLGSRY